MEPLPPFLKDKIKDETKPDANPLAWVLVEQALIAGREGLPLSECLAAAFDLVVASKFYAHVAPEGWLWCGHCNRDFYPILNACPYCVLESRFVHHKGHKPSSGQIGPATAEAFREIIAAYFALTGKDHCQVCNASEPIDLAIIDSESKMLFIAEVKAAPLFTPPLCRTHSADSMQTQTTLPLDHSCGVARRLHEAEFSLFVPDLENPFDIPLPSGVVGGGVPFNECLSRFFLEDPNQFRRFFVVWAKMWKAYQNKETESLLYWFCGACGLPRNPGEGWPKKANGRPEGSISDSKTSVGIDRTDDIKKATFQALKLGVDNRSKDSAPWTVMIGIASNLHAARHYDGYLKPYEDIIWGWSRSEGNPRELYNLFDGIVSFTRSHIRHDWLSKTLDWHGDGSEK